MTIIHGVVGILWLFQNSAMISLTNTFRISQLWKRLTDGRIEEPPGDKLRSKGPKTPTQKKAKKKYTEDSTSEWTPATPTSRDISSGPDESRPFPLRWIKRQESYDRTIIESRMLMKTNVFKEDEYKRIDFVLVTTKEICSNYNNNMEIHNFLRELVDIGVDFEIEFGVTFDEHFFIKSHVPVSCVNHLSNLYRTDFSCMNSHYSQERGPIFACFKTELHKYDDSSLLERAPESISGGKPRRVTHAERSMLLHRLMNETRYGTDPDEYGLESLTDRGLFIAAYPLHEGTYKWTNTGPLSDRQLLGTFWASYRMIFKKQPLNLIEKYFGTEIGMYFAWLEFYIKYLIPASAVGILCFIIGYINISIADTEHVKNEICQSNKIMCPYCEHYSLCPFTLLKDACSYSYLGFLLDNSSTVFFSMFMSIWATFFMVMWKRRLAMLKIRWNVYHLHAEDTVRQEFLLKATAQRFSRATGEMEPYIPNIQHCAHFVITNATVLFCALFIFSVALSVIVYQYKLRYIAHTAPDRLTSRKASWMASITGSVFIGLSILVFTIIYEKIALWLTKKECPRTQQAFDRGFIVKNCILNFSNNYAAITYLAFFKGKFFTYPGDSHQWNFLGGIATDLCGPGGCLADVGIQLAVVLTFPPIASCLVQFLKPYLVVKIKHYSNIFFRTDIPQWELDFYLGDTYKYFLFNEYRDLLIQYGYITCFVCALPVAPLFALIRNIFEVRLDASKFLKYHKRHVALKVDSLGAYSDILNWITYASVITNAGVIAFSSNFISRAIYRFQNNIGLRGYINSTLSVFNTNDYERSSQSNRTTNITTCYYHGKRYPPDHPNKYALTNDYFYQLIGQLAFVLVFEHVIVLIKVLLTTISRGVPRFVRDKIRMEETRLREERMIALTDNYKKTFSSIFSRSIVLPDQQFP